MIATLEGTLAETGPLQLVLEVGGIGYAVSIPLTTAERLPTLGQRLKLFIHAVYREDNQTLYGFDRRHDRDFFILLVDKVSGIGPRIALSILSRLSVETLEGAITAGDVGLLSQCKGVGKKTAERLVVELRDKLQAGGMAAPVDVGATASPLPAGSKVADAVAALVALGYKLPEADKAIRKAVAELGDDANTEALIKKALG
ncbi:MAG: Holliday junction branch migration protein RuvA [Opitutales bacterium]